METRNPYLRLLQAGCWKFYYSGVLCCVMW